MCGFKSFPMSFMLIVLSMGVHAEDLSFEEWEASVGAELGAEKSSLETIGLQPASSEELSQAAISDALQNRSITTSKPAYETLEEEQGEEREANSNDLALEQQTDLKFIETSIPEPIPYQEPIFSHDTGRELQHNNTAFERD
jgi:hypothetical protein